MDPEWHGRPLTLVLDHINGVNDDYRPDNLRLLCPNCHSQTPTFSGRNRQKRQR
jgi:5-methylcytosine-specific restriction endonuclease McrA